jgi:hypothetical protein
MPVFNAAKEESERLGAEPMAHSKSGSSISDHEEKGHNGASAEVYEIDEQAENRLVRKQVCWACLPASAPLPLSWS